MRNDGGVKTGEGRLPFSFGECGRRVLTDSKYSSVGSTRTRRNDYAEKCPK